VGPRAGLDTEARGKIEPRSPGRAVRSQNLYYLYARTYVDCCDNNSQVLNIRTCIFVTGMDKHVKVFRRTFIMCGHLLTRLFQPLVGICRHAIFQVLTAASMKLTAFWDVASCSLVEVNRRFRGLHGAISQEAVIFMCR
jgi:hypothetical protein